MIEPLGPYGPLHSIVPYTHRDNYTLLELIVEIRKKVNEISTYAAVQDDHISNFVGDVTKKFNELTNSVVDYVVTTNPPEGKATFTMQGGAKVEMPTYAKLTTEIGDMRQLLTNRLAAADTTMQQRINAINQLLQNTETRIEARNQELKRTLEARVREADQRTEAVATRTTAIEAELAKKYWHNVIDYGAKGNGTTDDTAAITRAIEAAGMGGIVFFPKGKYKITSTLNFLGDQTVIGSSSGYGDTAPNGSVILSTMQTDVAVSCTYALTIRDMRIHGPGPQHKQSTGVKPVKYIHMDNCSVFNFGTGIHMVENWYSNIDRCKLFYNDVAIHAERCYNLTINVPHIIAQAESNRYRIGVKLTRDSMVNIHGGSIESYSEAIQMAENCSVSCVGVYFESNNSGVVAGKRYGLKIRGYRVQANFHNCQIYLTNHAAFIDAYDSNLRGALTSIGNTLKGGGGGSESSGFYMNLIPGATGFRVVAVGDSMWHAETSIYKYRNAGPSGSLFVDPANFTL